MTIRDKLGWPVETIYNRPFTNFIRLLLYGNIKQTFIKLHKEKYIIAACELYSEGKINSEILHILTAKFDKI